MNTVRSDCATLRFAETVTRDNFVDLLKSGNYRGVDTRRISRVSFPD